MVFIANEVLSKLKGTLAGPGFPLVMAIFLVTVASLADQYTLNTSEEGNAIIGLAVGEATFI
jgi:hypothetical protein